jgi:DNA-binding response OmpR family regulator
METIVRKRVFVLEDEMMLALLLQMMLEALDYEAVGPPNDIFEGLRLAKEEPIDLAVLDVSLEDTYVYQIADTLRERQIPFLFLSDTGSQTLASDFATSAHLQKPFEMRDLEAALASLQWKAPTPSLMPPTRN